MHDIFALGCIGIYVWLSFSDREGLHYSVALWSLLYLGKGLCRSCKYISPYSTSCPVTYTIPGVHRRCPGRSCVGGLGALQGASD